MKHLIGSILAVFAIFLIVETSALGQTPPPASSQIQDEKQEPEPAQESPNADKGTVEAKKNLLKPQFRFTGSPIHFSKDVVASSGKNANVLALGKAVQSQTPPASSPSQTPQTAPAQGAEGSADLAQQLANPIASLISLPFQMNWDTGVGPEKDTRTTLNIQPVMPFKLNENWNFIARLIIPLVSQPPLVPGGETKFGMSDFLFSGFISPAKPKGFVWGIGPALLVPVTSEPVLGTAKVAIGPTALVLKQIGGLTVGALANHLWSVAGDDDRGDVNQTYIQPFLAYTTKTAWTYSLGSEMSFNWEAGEGEEVTAPITFGITKLVRLGRQPISLGPTVGYFIDQPGIGPKWKVRFTLTLLYPLGR